MWSPTLQGETAPKRPTKQLLMLHDMIFSLEKKICPFGTRPIFRGDTVSFSGGDYMMLHEFQEIIDQDQVIKLAHGTKPVQLRGYMFDNIHRWVCFLLLGKVVGKVITQLAVYFCFTAMFYHYTSTRSSRKNMLIHKKSEFQLSLSLSSFAAWECKVTNWLWTSRSSRPGDFTILYPILHERIQFDLQKHIVSHLNSTNSSGLIPFLTFSNHKDVVFQSFRDAHKVGPKPDPAQAVVMLAWRHLEGLGRLPFTWVWVVSIRLFWGWGFPYIGLT